MSPRSVIVAALLCACEADTLEPTVHANAAACHPLYREDLLPTFEMEIAPAEWAALADEYVNWEAREAAGLPTKPYHPLAAFRYGDLVVHDAAVRLRGNPCCSWGDPKMQFQISFNENDREGRLLGLRKLALDAPRYHRSFLRERIAYEVFQKVGVPSPCANNARLVVNGAYYGLYTNLEKVDREFLERVFDDPSGNLYKKGWTLETNEEDGDTSRQVRFWTTYDPPSLETLVDLDEAVQEWAVEAVLPDNDGYWSAGGNFYLYDHPRRGFVFVPWDMDSTFEVLPADTDPYRWQKPDGTGRRHYESVLADPVWFERYLVAVERSLAAYDVATLQLKIDRWAAQIAAAVVQDPSRPFTYESHVLSVANLRAYLEERTAFVTRWLGCWRSSTRDTDGDGVECNDL